MSFQITGAGGNRLRILRSTGPDRGNMQVCIGAGVCQTYSNYSQIPLYQQGLTILLPNNGIFTVTLTNLGTSGQYMDFDAVSMLSSPIALLTAHIFEDASSNISYSGQWLSSSSASYSNGTVKYTGVPNSSYTFLINASAGSRLQILRTVGPDKGPMRVCFSEVFACQTVSDSNPVTLYQQPFTIATPWTGTYPVTVTFMGSNGQYVDVDELVLLSPPITLTAGTAFEDTNVNLTYNGVWISDSNASYSNGSVKYTGQNGASVSFTVNVAAGNRLTLLRTAAPDHGLMQMCIGVQCTTFSNYGLPTAYQQELNVLMPNAGTYPITLTNLGSGGTPYMDFDAVVLNASPTALSEGTTYQESSSSLLYSGQWIQSDDSHYGSGHVRYTSQPDSTVTFMVNGTAGHYLVLYRTKGPDKGSMQVCFSQIYNCQTISNTHGSVQYQQPISIALPWTAVYPVTVRFTGSLGQYMDIDEVALSAVQVMSFDVEATPEVTDIVTPTPDITEAVTEAPIPDATETVEPTAEVTDAPTQLPTALPFPTLALPTDTPAPLTLPAYASMDDGAPDWSALSGWTLTPEAGFSGLGWQVIASNQADVLRWDRQIDLTRVLPGQVVQLSFESLLSSDRSIALVQISTDGLNWTTVDMPITAADWQQDVIDLAGYIGRMIQVQFVWQGVAPSGGAAPDRWQVDQVSVVGVAPPTALPTSTPTDTPPAVTEAPAPTESATEPRNSISGVGA